MAKRVLDKLDYDQQLGDKDEYEERLEKLQLELLDRQLAMRADGPVVIVFEGWDAAGKGGAIRRLTEKMDPRGYQVWPISAPTEEEKAHHYLWRFWRRMPARGAWAIFDRSWYGRVLVERVEKFAPKDAWQRAYREINELERALVDDGVKLVKIFLAITKDEQLERFEERQNNPAKHWKIGPDDWRNRDKWDDYVAAAEDMFEQTSTVRAPWVVIGANRKWYARVRVCETILEGIGR